jgi:hypothetical protein
MSRRPPSRLHWPLCPRCFYFNQRFGHSSKPSIVTLVQEHHLQAIYEPAELDGVFTQPKSIYEFHEVIAILDPALAQICTHASRLPYTPRTSSFRTLSPSSPANHPMAKPTGNATRTGHGNTPSHTRPETKAKLKRRAQEIAARSKARLAAGRKKHADFMADPQGYRTTPTQAANSTGRVHYRGRRTARAKNPRGGETARHRNHPANAAGQPRPPTRRQPRPRRGTLGADFCRQRRRGKSSLFIAPERRS